MSTKLDDLFFNKNSQNNEVGAAETTSTQLARKLPNETHRLQTIALQKLIPYPNQPFKLYPEQEMQQLLESIAAHGIMQPLRVRPYGDTYQIVDGHNRWTAAQAIGLASIPCIVQEMSDDEAIIYMVETNLHKRENISPSERAWAYRMRTEAIKRQAGRPAKENGGHDVPHLKSAEVVGEENDESARQVRRYIRLTYLIAPLLDMIDADKLTLVAGVQLSYLKEEIQNLVLSYLIETKQIIPNEKLAKSLRELDEKSELTEQLIDTLITAPPKPTKPPAKISIKYTKVKKYLAEVPEKEVEQYIVKALEYYQSHAQA